MADLKALQVQLQELKTQRNAIMGGAVGSGITPEAVGTERKFGASRAKDLQSITKGKQAISSAEAAQGLAAPLLEEGGGRVTSVTAGPSGTTVKIDQGPEAKIAEAQGLADIEVDKQVKAQKQKDIADTRQNLTNARLKIGTAFDSWLDVVDRTQRITKVGPGIAGGVITEVLGKTKANEFVNAFKGGLTEYAAAIGRIAMPGARATRLISLFKETAPTTFDTVPSAIEQSALSFKNGLATSMSREPETYLPEFAGSNDDYNKLDDMLRNFQTTYREGLYKLAFDKNPELVPPEMRRRLEAESGGELVAGTSDDDINELLDRLGG